MSNMEKIEALGETIQSLQAMKANYNNMTDDQKAVTLLENAATLTILSQA
jgi:hypothetical protein